MASKRRISAETFISEWQRAESIDAFSKASGLKPHSASRRACFYRRRGIPLKRFPRGGGHRALDVDALVKLANKYAPIRR